jgi:hypothetical protein
MRGRLIFMSPDDTQQPSWFGMQLRLVNLAYVMMVWLVLFSHALGLVHFVQV